MIAGLAGAVAVPCIPLRIEKQAAEYMERLPNGLPVASRLQCVMGYVALAPFGASLFTWFLIALAFAAVFWLHRWRNR
jgi:hypothetical protein